MGVDKNGEVEGWAGASGLVSILGRLRGFRGEVIVDERRNIPTAAEEPFPSEDEFEACFEECYLDR